MKTKSLILVVAFAFQSNAIATPPARPLYGISVNPSNLQRAVDWQQWTGKTPAIIGDSTFSLNWQGLTGTIPNAGTAIAISRHKPGSGDPPNPMGNTNYILELAVPMFPTYDNSGTPYNTISNRFSSGASGNFDSYWQSFAQTLVGKGLGNTIIRLGWEFNIPYYSGTPWAIGDTDTATMANFAAYWRKIHDAMMSVSGANFKWSWSMLAGEDTAQEFSDFTTYAYPGNSYVDYISVDVYDSSYFAGYWKYNWQANSLSWPDQLSDTVIQDRTWEEKSAGVYRETNAAGNIDHVDAGLSHYKTFANSKNKKLIISECGIVNQDRAVPSIDENGQLFSAGNNDNPYFVKKLYDWAWENEAYAIVYFEFYLGRKYGAIENTPTIINHSLLPEYWQTTSGTDGNPLNPEPSPHPRSAGALLKALGSASSASTAIPSARKYVGTLKIPSMDNDWLFQSTTGSSPVYLASIPTVVKANVTGTVGQWQGISFMGLSNEVGYAFEGYCASPTTGSDNMMQFRITKNGSVIYSASKSITLSSVASSEYGNEGKPWSQNSEEMSVTVTNEITGGVRIKVMFGPNVVGEVSDGYQLSGRVDGQTYNGQTLNGVRLINKEVLTSWFYQENFDDGSGDGFWLSGWIPEKTQLHAPASSSEKVAYRGSYTDQDYTICCQIATNVTGKAAGVNFLTSALGNGYRVELKSKDETGGYSAKNILDTVKLYRTGWPAPVLLQTKTMTKRFYMGVHQDLKIRTSNLSSTSNKFDVYLNDELLFEYTDSAAVSTSGVAGPWAEPDGSAWIDNYIQLPTL